MNVPIPKIPKSNLIMEVQTEQPGHIGTGDMWPLTWGKDDNIYAAAGDNFGIPKTTFSPMNIFIVQGVPAKGIKIEEIHHLPVDPKIYCWGPLTDINLGIKPAGMLCVNGVLYLSVENINYGDNPRFNRQHNLNGWIITSNDNGRTWNADATRQSFFTGRTASAHFLQFGRDYALARDEFVYAYFPSSFNGQSYWCNNDGILIGRVPKNAILTRAAWQFLSSFDNCGVPIWNNDDSCAIPVFSYPGFTGENHVSYNVGLKRYLMGNYAFYDDNGRPMPVHQAGPAGRLKSQLTLYESPEPWGPWRLFWTEDNWDENYQPVFPVKWMSADGLDITMVYAGSNNYNFTTRKIHLKIS